MTTTHHNASEFDDLLGIRPAALAEPVPRGTQTAARGPVTIDHETQKPVTPTQRKVSASRVREMAAQLVAGKADKIDEWIEQVAKVSPKAALDIILQLMEFSTPRLKAIAMQIDDNTPQGKAARQMTTEQLQQLVAGKPAE